MPRIILKPKSPEFADDSPAQETRSCDMPGCRENAPHKAPKHRALNEYFWFCLDHVKEYNRAWDFFYGMPEHEVQEHMNKSIYGDRPTWRSDMHAATEEALKRKAWQGYHYTDKEPPGAKTSQNGFQNAQNAPEFEALAIMGLEPPVTLADIKARYKILAKKHHPDLNKGCLKSEELLKHINMAYTILKVAYEHFEKLPDKN